MGIREQGDIPNRMLTGHRLDTAGQRMVGWIRFTGISVDAETITIGGRVYEFDDDSTYTSGHVQVDVSGSTAAAASATAFVAAVNADTHSGVTAVLLDTDTVGLIADSDGDDSISLAEATTNMVISAAALTDGVDAAELRVFGNQYTVTAADVTGWAAGDPVVIAAGEFANGAPNLTGVTLRDSNHQLLTFTTANFAIYWRQVGSTNVYYLQVLDGAADLSNTNTITWAAVG